MLDPYTPVPLPIDANEDRHIYGRLAASVLCFLGTTIVVWVLFISMFFRDSAEIWPGWFSLFPASGFGFGAFRITSRRGTPILLSLCLVFTCLLVAMLIIGYSFVPDGIRLSLIPDAEFGFAPVHWVLAAFSTVSLGAGLVAQISKIGKLRLDAQVVLAVSICLSLAYAVCWIGGACSVIASVA